MSLHRLSVACFFVCSLTTSVLWGHSNEQHQREIQNLTFEGEIIESDVLFKISIPYPVLLKDEIPQIVYAFKNTSRKPFNVGREFLGVNDSAHCTSEPQSRVWLQFSDGQSARVDTNAQVGRNWDIIESGFEAEGFLAVGDSAVVMGEYRPGFARYYEAGFNQLRVLFMVDNEKYIVSNWLEIEVLNEEATANAEQFEIDYGSEVGYKAPVYIRNVHNERWLFIHRNRIAKIPKEATPRFLVDKGASILTIHFDGTDYEPVVHNVRMIRTLSGPRELIPHIYAVEDMKTEISGLVSSVETLSSGPVVTEFDEPSVAEAANASSANEPEVDRPVEIAPTGVMEEVSEQPSQLLPWSIGLLVAIGALGFVVMRVKRRQRA